ncbi:MAG: hypothetical protein OEZ16_08630 [Chromatiales bacterium]|nr:hypothetical protein [Chromatiales bacterium]
MKKGNLALLLVVAFGSGAAQAANTIDVAKIVGQDTFLAVSKDLASATSYKGLIPAESMGITGFDIGIEATSTKLQNTAEIDAACGGCGLDTLVIPKVHLHKGLPFGLDVGMMYAGDSNANVELIGYELRYAIVEGGVAMPAVGARLSYSKLDGIDALSLESKGIDISVSKGFAMFTPYAGVGQNWVSASATGFKDEDFTQSKTFVGANINFGLINFAVEADKTGDASTVGAKLGIRF